MKYSAQEVIQYINEEDVKFIRLAFCDIFGKQKNISIMPYEISRAFSQGIAIDASAVAGFGGNVHSDLFLHPEPDTLAALPWRPEHGRVVRMFCNITYPDGKPFENDIRSILKKAIADADKAGYKFSFGSEIEFYLFKLDENGEPTKIPYDNAGYMDIAPDDKGENVRREICLTLEQMGIIPESSHHEEGPGQNEIDFRYSDALTAADNAITFCMAVKSVAAKNGLYADFSPKPLKDKPGSGFHINISAADKNDSKRNLLPFLVSGILEKISDITVFLNPSEKSFERHGSNKAPKYISWSNENRSQLIRIPAAYGEYQRAEIRSPDPKANPYLAFTLLIYAGLYGIQNKLDLQDAADINLYEASSETLAKFKTLPQTLKEAIITADNSSFVKEHLPQMLISAYCKSL